MNASGTGPRGRDDIVFRQLDDEWVLYDPRSNRIHALNLTAALVWAECTGDASIETIANRVREAFGSSPPASDVTADVEATIARFRTEGLLA